MHVKVELNGFLAKSEALGVAKPESGPAVIFDVRTKRLDVTRDFTKQLRAQERKVLQAVSALGTQLAPHEYTKASREDEYHNALELLQAALLTLNMKPQGAGEAQKGDYAQMVEAYTTMEDLLSVDRILTGYELSGSETPPSTHHGKKPTTIKLEDPEMKLPDSVQFSVVLSQHLTKFITSLSDLPMDAPDALVPFAALEMLIAKAKSATTEMELTLAVDDFETQKTLQNQLATALNAAKRSLGSEQKIRKVDKDKMVKDTEAKVAEQVRLEQEGRDSRGAAALLHAKHAKAFSAPWKDAGHPEVRVVQFTGLEGEIFTKKNADPFAEPFICKGYMVDPASALGKTMVSWKTAFALNAEKKGQDKCQAPMTSVHHVDDTSLLLKTVFPEKYHVKHLLPSVEKMCEHVFMYGYSENMTSYDFEPGALGCTRWVHSGSVAMLLVPAVDLAMNLAKVQKIGQHRHCGLD